MYYWPQHFEQVVSDCLAHFDFIIDCHSYPKDPLPYELHQTSPRPQICLGTDSFHTPDALITATKDHLIVWAIPWNWTLRLQNHCSQQFLQEKTQSDFNHDWTAKTSTWMITSTLSASRDKLVKNLATLVPVFLINSFQISLRQFNIHPELPAFGWLMMKLI